MAERRGISTRLASSLDKSRSSVKEKDRSVDKSSRSVKPPTATPDGYRSRTASLLSTMSRDSNLSKAKGGEETGSEIDFTEFENEGDERNQNVQKDMNESVVTVISEEAAMDRKELIKMKEIGTKLRKCLFAENNRVMKGVSECVRNCVSEYEQCLMRLMCENEWLKGRLEECKKESAPILNERSYASVVGKKGGVNALDEMKDQKSMSEKKFAVIIKPRNENEKMSSEQVKERVMNAVSKDLNVRVRAVRKIKNGGIAVETVSEKELSAIKECKRFGEIGMKVEEPRKIGPKVIIFDVPVETTNEELLRDIYVKNVSECVSEKEFYDKARVVNRFNKKDECLGSAIVELNARMYGLILNEGRVYIKWRACKVKEYISVLRCHNCCAFGHMAKECKEKVSVCHNCGQEGHNKSDCKKNECCRNCKIRGLKSDHSVMARECPEFVRTMQREKGRICME